MARTASQKIKFTKHASGKAYKKGIGKAYTSKGNLSPKVFWLGTDEAKAHALAVFIVSEWVQLQAEDHSVWTIDALQRIEDRKLSLYGGHKATPARSSLIPSPVIAKPQSLHEAIQRYTDHIRQDQANTTARREYVVYSVESIKQLIPNMPLNEVGPEQIASIVSYWSSLPKSPRTNKAISTHTALARVCASRMFFDWLDVMDHWQAPRRFDRLFKVNRSTLNRQARRNGSSSTIKAFTMDELKDLFAQANDQQRLFMLLGLNCGFGATDLATLKLNEIKEDRIEASRSKTDVYGRFPLWKITSKYLSPRVANTPANDQGLALLTKNGHPLFRYHGKSNINAVALTWSKLLNRCKEDVRPLPFKVLRKTASQMVRDKGGRDLASLFLRHVDQSVSGQHYNQASDAEFDRLAEVLQKIEDELHPVFEG